MINKIGIYKLTSPNGKIYIGQSVNLHRRINRYKLLDCKHQYALYNSIIKYGWDNFKIEILWSSNDKTNYNYVLNQLEKDFINLYDCLSPNGYNLKEGGGVFRFSDETKSRMSEGQKLRRLNMSSDDKKLMGNKISYGKTKTYLQFTKEDIFIREWYGLGEVIKLGIVKSDSNVYMCCKGKRNTAGGYKWKYKN